MHVPPVVLSVAGSDSSSGAGIQADLKTFSASGVYGLTAVSCVVAEVPGKVGSIHAVPSTVVAEQMRLLLGAFPVSAMKTGLLYSREIVKIVADELAVHAQRTGNRLPLVVDPVMVATAGASLLKEGTLEEYRRRLFHCATLLTPNLSEAGVLLGRPVQTRVEMEEAARELSGRYACSVLVKGGHHLGERASDVLVGETGKAEWFEAEWVRGVATHGTGCTYSAAITAGLAMGKRVSEAVHGAKRFVTKALAGFFRWDGVERTIDGLAHFPVDGWGERLGVRRE